MANSSEVLKTGRKQDRQSGIGSQKHAVLVIYSFKWITLI